jgi:ferritin-like metal-binding protein YciE
MRFMKAVNSALIQDDFDSVLLAELHELRKTEKALAKMYPRLKSKPQLRNRFMQQLADMQQRTSRLDAVLNPIAATQLAPPVSTAVQISVA